VFFECAQALGRRVVVEVRANAGRKETQRRRIRHAFRLCLARDPSEGELQDVALLCGQLRKQMNAHPAVAAEVVGHQPTPTELAAEELAVWVLVGRTLLNLDEFITRE
jgi:hypothetical protein